jgi:hypothetical protein
VSCMIQNLEMRHWKDAIGDFMVSFNECEFWVHQYVLELLPTNVATLVGKERLQKRSEFVQAAIKDATLSVPPQLVQGVFTRLGQLAEFRNLLAHNAPVTNVVGSSVKDWRPEIQLIHKERQVTLDEIRAKAEDARELESEMEQLFLSMYAERHNDLFD